MQKNATFAPLVAGNRLPDGVTVAQQILVLYAQVRILVGQLSGKMVTGSQ